MRWPLHEALARRQRETTTIEGTPFLSRRSVWLTWAFVVPLFGASAAWMFMVGSDPHRWPCDNATTGRNLLRHAMYAQLCSWSIVAATLVYLSFGFSVRRRQSPSQIDFETKVLAGWIAVPLAFIPLFAVLALTAAFVFLTGDDAGPRAFCRVGNYGEAFAQPVVGTMFWLLALCQAVLSVRSLGLTRVVWRTELPAPLGWIYSVTRRVMRNRTG